MKKLFKFALPVLVLIIAWFLVNYIQQNPTQTPKDKALPEPRMNVQVQRLELEAFTPVIHSVGEVKASVSGSIMAEVSGKLIYLSPKLSNGAVFAKDEVLARVDARLFESDVVIAEGNLASANLKLDEETALGRQARADWQRMGRAGEPSEMVLRIPHLQAAEAQLKAAEAKLLQSKINLEKTELKAPYAGQVISKYVSEGHYINAGAVIADIMGAEKYEIHLPLSLNSLAYLGLEQGLPVTKGTDLEISLAAQFGSMVSTWTARPVKLNPFLDRQSRQVMLVAEIEAPKKGVKNTGGVLKTSQFLHASLKGKAFKEVFVVPLSSLYENRYVFVAQEERLRKRAIELIWRDEQQAVIRGELQEGDLLVITPLGAPVSGTLLSFEQPL